MHLSQLRRNDFQRLKQRLDLEYFQFPELEFETKLQPTGEAPRRRERRMRESARRAARDVTHDAPSRRRR